MNVAGFNSVNTGNYTVTTSSIRRVVSGTEIAASFEDMLIKSSQYLSKSNAENSADNRKLEFFEKISLQGCDYLYKTIPAEYFEHLDLNDDDTLDFFNSKDNLFAFAALVDNFDDYGIPAEEMSKLNFGANTESSLSKEQISQLKEKYDVTNMTDDERFHLMYDLHTAGAISLKELAYSCIFTVDASKEGMVEDERLPLMNGNGFLAGEKKAIPTNWIDMLLLMKKEDASAYAYSLSQGIKMDEWYLERNDNILEIFEILSRDENSPPTAD